MKDAWCMLNEALSGPPSGVEIQTQRAEIPLAGLSEGAKLALVTAIERFRRDLVHEKGAVRDYEVRDDPLRGEVLRLDFDVRACVQLPSLEELTAAGAELEATYERQKGELLAAEPFATDEEIAESAGLPRNWFSRDKRPHVEEAPEA